MKSRDIGLRQARRLCQMPHEERLALLAEGLPIILSSAQGFWQGACHLKDRPREAEVLKGLAEEEASKILILMDAVRCPKSLIGSKIGNIVGWFYNHLARLIYAEAVHWRPMHVAQLREYVDQHRESHYVEGAFGEFIAPNWSIYQRESRLYADIESYEDGALNWNAPNSNFMHIADSDGLSLSVPPALEVTEAMSVLGIFTHQGLKATSKVWHQLTFTNTENSVDARRLTRELIKRLCEENLPTESATQHHADELFTNWQIPMYDIDFSQTNVPLERLKEEQERILWAEMGEGYEDAY